MDINIILTAVITALSVAFITSGTFVLMYIFEKRRITGAIRAYFEAPNEETPSHFGETIDGISRLFAARLVAQIKTTVMGMNSVDSKNAKREAVNEAIEGSPSLAGLAQILPKRWVKPEILALAASLLNKKPKGDNGEEGDKEQRQLFRL